MKDNAGHSDPSQKLHNLWGLRILPTEAAMEKDENTLKK